MGAKRILVVDDNPDVLRLVDQALTTAGYDVTTSRTAVGRARRRAVAARSRAPRHRPARRGRLHGLRQAARKAGGLICPIIFLTAAGDIDSRLHGFEQGAVDYIVKPFHIKELLARIKVHLHEDEQPKGDVPSPLTEREREVVKLLASGKTYKQVAHALQVSQSTVRNHLHNVYHKLDVVDRAQAVIVSREHGWI